MIFDREKLETKEPIPELSLIVSVSGEWIVESLLNKQDELISWINLEKKNNNKTIIKMIIYIIMIKKWGIEG